MRNVTNSSGETKPIHSSHGDVAHKDAGPEHAQPKEDHSVRNSAIAGVAGAVAVAAMPVKAAARKVRDVTPLAPKALTTGA